MLTFKTYADLIRDTQELSKNLTIPDLIVAIPKSGMIPALILAEKWNVPITTPELLNEGRTIGHGKRPIKEINFRSHLLIIDDTINTGRAMSEVKENLSRLSYTAEYAAVYAKKSISDVKHQQIIPQPRVFEWNWLNHELMMMTCFDMDGVLCRAPTVQENDYGPNYEVFLEETQPIHIPKRQIKAIITGRLEKYREKTEKWLKQHGVAYEVLIMRPNIEVPHAQHKSKWLSTSFSKCLFVDDDTGQAEMIHKLTGQPVLCVTNWKIYQRE
jgi:orotate phosphoribosyltransferase